MTGVDLFSGPHTRAHIGVPQVMRTVMLAIAPATAFGVGLFGWPAIYLFLITCISALTFEAMCLRLAGRPVRRDLFDGSALLSAWLLAMTLPPWAPWWLGVTGAFLAIVVGKQIFGGIGQNVFNPAMVARVALLVSFPVEMTTWISPAPLWMGSGPGLAESWHIIFGGAIPDSYTGATLIGYVKTEVGRHRDLAEALAGIDYHPWRAFFGYIRGSLAETSTLLLLLGGLWLLRKRIITWHIPAAVLATVGLLAFLFHSADATKYPGPWFHLCSGGVMLCAFFIATDYVTSPNSPLGQLIFGVGVGAILFIIRTFGGYPEGVGFAVLLMNAATPLIDHYVRPRIFGRDWRGRPLGRSKSERSAR